ncbi:MAG: tryptophan 2,3-dioxygenase [Methylobacteriaceae bacterium]|nr:tryptophan 2,3-dioxygenase [Methylobacteriaceae bacterium]MBV9245547.1 tryptophan 2,3-dioxygenase [Methylobacteriaceae bacterium]MBV9636688.1 tryptophan 2,3-dioxygenase [Methylobacteriaceae bacterium]MBV9704428.1 tryptophan 2,3-dioxygenase [Methylobacteriaceae bacterium]
MDRSLVYESLKSENERDYEIYLDCKTLLSLQKPVDELCNQDELQFQIVHQVEELWMKLAAHTLLDIDDYLIAGNTPRALTLMRRVDRILELMTAQLTLLETMSPKEYQEIRLRLGNGSGQESPGFRTLLRTAPHLWQSFEATYLVGQGKTVEQIYNSRYAHDEAYVLAEALIEFDELFQKFRWHHIMLIHRSIGMGAASLKGRSVDLLQTGARHRFYPQLWDIRSKMTDAWGNAYGHVRDPLSDG